MLRAPFEFVTLFSPGLAIPDLEPVANTRDDDLAPELRVGGQRRGDHDSPLPVDLDLDCPRVVVALHLTCFAAEGVEGVQLPADHALPFLARKDVEAFVQPARDNHTGPQLLTESRWKGESVLVIDRVLVLAKKHGRGLISRRVGPTLNHL